MEVRDKLRILDLRRLNSNPQTSEMAEAEEASPGEEDEWRKMPEEEEDEDEAETPEVARLNGADQGGKKKSLREAGVGIFVDFGAAIVDSMIKVRGLIESDFVGCFSSEIELQILMDGRSCHLHLHLHPLLFLLLHLFCRFQPPPSAPCLTKPVLWTYQEGYLETGLGKLLASIDQPFHRLDSGS